MAEPFIVYGGTFDPVHDGHLAVARAVRDRFRATVRLLPAGRPPHRGDTRAPAAHRLAMLRLALAGEPGLLVDTREIDRAGPSWTIDTVEALRRELPPAQPLLLVVGMDSLRNFTLWRRWQDILGNAHLVACSRPGEALPDIAALGAHRLAEDAGELLDEPGGRLLVESSTAATISATGIRRALAAGESPPDLPPAVLAYIRRHHLYHATGATPPE